MKGLKIFGWTSLVLSVLCFFEMFGIFDQPWFDDFFLARLFWNFEFPWAAAGLIFCLAAILSWLLIRALNQIKEELELKILMNT
jgi:hypothetical protein